MKRPVNFETIDAVDFEIHGHSCHTDLDKLQNILEELVAIDEVVKRRSN